MIGLVELSMPFILESSKALTKNENILFKYNFTNIHCNDKDTLYIGDIVFELIFFIFNQCF